MYRVNSASSSYDIRSPRRPRPRSAARRPPGNSDYWITLATSRHRPMPERPGQLWITVTGSRQGQHAAADSVPDGDRLSWVVCAGRLLEVGGGKSQPGDESSRTAADGGRRGPSSGVQAGGLTSNRMGGGRSPVGFDPTSRRPPTTWPRRDRRDHPNVSRRSDPAGFSGRIVPQLGRSRTPGPTACGARRSGAPARRPAGRSGGSPRRCSPARACESRTDT